MAHFPLLSIVHFQSVLDYSGRKDLPRAQLHNGELGVITGGLFLDRSGADFLTDLYDTEAHDPVQYNLPLGIFITERYDTERLPLGF